MFTSINCTVFDIPLTWDRNRFEASRNKCQQARKLIEASVNAQFNKRLRDVFYEKLDIEKNILESQQRLANQEKKVRALDNLTEVAAQSLTDYFDKRMETVRTAIQEHCNAIQEILREENDHWEEIHFAIDQNLITLDDIHPPKNIDQETPLANIHTIDEVDEEEHTSKLLNDKTVTPLLTQMIRKSRLLSNRSSIRRSNLPLSTENLIQSKEERVSVMIPLTSARRTLPVVDTTFVVKLEDSKSTESNQSHQVETEQPEPLPVTTIIPIESVPMTTVTPIDSVSTAEVEASPSYSQPKLPARLYFSPTLLLDDGESEPIQPILSTIDQNQSVNIKPKIAPRRFGQTFLLDNVKTEEIDTTQDTENIRPNISDEIPFLIHTDPTLLPDKQTLNESNHPELEIADIQKSIVYTKRRTRAVAEPKPNPEPVHRARRTARKPKAVMETEPIKRPARKRKQSVADLDDGNTNTVALPKKKASRAATKSTTRKPRAKKEKEIPIREPSPLPIIDRSKHYSTRFSTRSHRLNNRTLSTIPTLSEDEKHSKPKRSRTKSTKLDAESVVKKPRAKKAKEETQTRAKSMITTRNRKK